MKNVKPMQRTSERTNEPALREQLSPLTLEQVLSLTITASAVSLKSAPVSA